MATDSILAALQQQLGCYQRLAKLAQTQHDHVQNSRTEDLLLVLSHRQEVLDQIADLEQSIGPVKKRWAEYLAEQPADQRAQAEELLAETRRLLEEITTSDRRDALALQQRKMNLGREINQTAKARVLNQNYAHAAYGRRPAALDIQR
jgi:hypothetical protein